MAERKVIVLTGADGNDYDIRDEELHQGIGSIPLGNTVEGQISALENGKVPTTRKVNNKDLSSDITLVGTDIPVSSSDNTKVDSALANKVPTTRKVNNKALSSDVTLYGSDIPVSALDNTKLDTAIGDLKSAIDETATYETYANLFDKTAILTGKGLQVGSGHTINDVVDIPTLNVSGIIEVDGGQTYKSNSVLFGNNTARIYGYRDTGIYGGGIDPTISDGVCTYSIPALIKYVRFEYGPATVNIDQYMFVKGNLPSEYEPYGKHLVGGELYDVEQELLSKISDVDAKVGGLDIRNKLFCVANTIDDNGFTQGAYPDGSTGQIVTNASWTTFWCSDYTPILGGVTYYYNKIYFGGHFAFYDADQNFISGYEGVSVPNPFTSPTNAAYVRFLVVSSTVGAARDAWLNIINEAPEDTTTKYGFDKNTIFLADVDNPCDYSGNEISAFNKIICIGDSITEGTFNHNEGGTMQYVVYGKYSYPTYLTKLCGVETYNAGVGGYTSVQWWNNKQSMITSGYDCAIINLGINDALTGVSTSDTQTALTNIVNALKTANNNIKIFMATVVPAYSDGNTQFDAVNAVIKAVATANGCYVVDLSQYSHARQATVCEAGHLTAWGYCQLAKDYIAAISYIMSKNRDAFKFIQFIGTTYSYA